MKPEFYVAINPAGERVNITCSRADLQQWLDAGYRLIDETEVEPDAADETDEPEQG